MLIERDYSKDLVILRDEVSFKVVAKRVRTAGRFFWRSEDPKIQELLDGWNNGSTIGAIVTMLEKRKED